MILKISYFLAAICQSLAFMSNEIPDGGKLWVFLTAGSNGYFNYRHQADVCHAYQIVHAHGVPDENIIVMMYDDIANNTENPDKGVIINRPNGPNVYSGVPKDYTGKDVTSQNFLDILMGKKMGTGSGKTLDSGPNDHIFLYFSDHGAIGLLGFPMGSKPLLATDFIRTLKAMHVAKRFRKMTIYVEACESGSMFKGLLPESVDIFATTASNATTSSYACYYDQHLRTFLGDVYSVKWLEDSDHENLAKESLEQQYKIVKRETNTSQVCQFGDMTISQMMVSDFQGDEKLTVDPTKFRPKTSPFDPTCGRDAVPSPEVPRVILGKRIESATTEEDKEEAMRKYRELMQGRQLLRNVTVNVVTMVTNGLIDGVMNANLELTNFACYEDVVNAYHAKCFSLTCNEYAMREINFFANMCEMGYTKGAIVDAINDVCNNFDDFCGLH